MTLLQYAFGTLIREQMGVRGVICVFVLMIMPLALALPDFRSNTGVHQVSFDNMISSLELNEDMETKCGLGLNNVEEAIQNLKYYSRSNSDAIGMTLAKANVQIAIEVLDPHVKKAFLDCLRKMNLMFLESGEEKSSANQYMMYIDSLFYRSSARRQRRLLQNLSPSPSSVPAPSPASASSSSSPTPSGSGENSQSPPTPFGNFFPKDLNSSSSQPVAGEPSPNLSEQSNKKNSNHKTVVIAVAVTAAVTFIIVAVLFYCYYRVCVNRRGVGRNDEGPFVRLSLSNFSFGSPDKSFASTNSITKERPGSLSFQNNSNHYIEPGVPGTTKAGIPLETVNGVAMTTYEESAQKQPSSVKSSPAKFVTAELPPLKHSSGSANPSELLSPGKGAPPPPPPPGKRAPAPPPPPGKGAPPLTVLPPSQRLSSVPHHHSGVPPPPPPPAPSTIKTGTRPPPPPPPVSVVPPPKPPTIGFRPPRPSTHGPNYPSSSAFSEGDDADVPKARLKPFFWDKVLANPDHSMVWHQIKSGSFQFDEEMIESLFGAPAGKNKENKVDSSRPGPVTHYVQIIDQKKSQNLSILLKALNVTTEEVCDALQEGNELPSELLETLLKMAPTTEEEMRLKLYSGEVSRLGTAERFLKVLVEIPFAFKRLETLLFMCTLQEEAATIKGSFTTLEAACTELKRSRLFLKLLEAVLKTGNRMNDGTFRGRAQAFKLDTLLKLSDVKGTDGKTTLLHFVVQEIIRSEGVRAARIARESRGIKPGDLENPSHDLEDHYRSLGLQVVSGLANELENVKKAAGIDSDSLTGTVTKLGHGLLKAKDFLNSDMKKIDEQDRFHQVLRSFMQSADIDVMWLLEEEKRITALVKSTADYFHGNAGKDEGLRLFVIVRDFLIILNKSCKEVKDAQKKMNTKPKKEDKIVTPSGPQQAPSPDPRERLFPAIRDRRMNSYSSDEDSS